MYGEKIEMTLNVCTAGIERMLNASRILRRCDGSQDLDRNQVAGKRLTLLS